MVDQLQECRLGPVDVLEDDDERAFSSELLEQLADTPKELLDRERGEREPDRRGDPVSHLRAARMRERCELRASFFCAVALGDRGRVSDHLDQRPEGDAVAVRQAASAQDKRSRRD